ncbi:hypothetical protein MK280_19405 [Myxococcota bacterium]|nr:hypothetical protein [Myxococcota bacterium]
MPRRRHRVASALADERWALCVLFLVALGYALWALPIGWNHSIVDHHGFRQSQTAISTYYLLQGGPWLAYETPILGPAWSVPFEFPLYQWIVALLTHTTGMDLEAAGRLTSSFFFFGSVLPIWSILGYLRVERAHRLAFLALFFVSPIYLFWSRTFMIESTALFLSLCYLAFAARWLERRRPADATLSSFFGICAALVKITTFVGFCYAAAALVLVRWFRVHRGHINLQILLEQLLPLLCFAILPVAAVTVWVSYTDDIKSLNLIAGRHLISENLVGWNFGNIAQRIDPASWTILRSRLHLWVGQGAFFTAALGVALASPRAWLPVLGSLALFLATFLTFANLHLVHDYYQYANAIFLIAAVGFSLRSLLVGSLAQRWAGVIALGFVMVSCIESYRETYLEIQKRDAQHLEPLAQEIQRRTSVSDVIVVWGADWSSEIPYLARRRALMMWPHHFREEGAVAEALRRLEDYNIGAMIVCGENRSDPSSMNDRSDLFGMESAPVFSGTACQLHLPAGASSVDS